MTQGTLGTYAKTFEVTSYGRLPSPQRTVDLGFVQASVTPEGTEFRLDPKFRVTPAGRIVRRDGGTMGRRRRGFWVGPSPRGPGGPRHPRRVWHIHPNTNAYSHVDGHPNATADTCRDAGADRHRQAATDIRAPGHGHPKATAYSYVDARPDGHIHGIPDGDARSDKHTNVSAVSHLDAHPDGHRGATPTLTPTPTAIHGEWLGLWIAESSTGTTTWIGSLRFPRVKGEARIAGPVYSTVEIYGGGAIRPIDIPTWHVASNGPGATDIRPSGARRTTRCSARPS